MTVSKNDVFAEIGVDSRPDSELTREEIIARNLKVVDFHFHSKTPEQMEKAVAVYADDITWEAPSRGVVMKDPTEVLQAYRDIFRTLAYRKTLGLRRFATEDFVFDDQVAHAYVVGDPALMPNMPYPKGTEIYARLVHCFQMRDGLISREIVYEVWREHGSENAHDDIPEDPAWEMVVSNSPVIRVEEGLAGRGLVVALPQRGCRVRKLSVEDVVGLTESRVRIESVALRLAIERGDVRWETKILAAHHLLERTPLVDDDGKYRKEWGVRHRNFHRALTAGCNNARLQEVVLGLRDSAELYRWWWRWALATDRRRDLAAEHRQLKDSTLARDADAAIEALAHHIKRAPDQLIAYAHEHGLDDLNGPPWQAE